MVIFLLFSLLASSAYSLEKVEPPVTHLQQLFEICLASLELYNDFLPGTPSLVILSDHPEFLNLMEQVADQDDLWLNRSDRIRTVLIQMIRNQVAQTPRKTQAQTLSIFLAAAQRKGNPEFVNGITSISNDSILKASLETGNDQCAQVVHQYLSIPLQNGK